MKKINAYVCNFCKGIDKRPMVVREHEEECAHNPKNKTCETCTNLGESCYCKIKKYAIHKLVINCKSWNNN